MSNFSESEHPRAVTGAFRDKTQSGPETSIEIAVDFSYDGVNVRATRLEQNIYRMTGGEFRNDFFFAGDDDSQLEAETVRIYNFTKIGALRARLEAAGGRDVSLATQIDAFESNTSTPGWGDIQEGTSRWFDDDDFEDPFIATIEVFRTSEETDADNGSGSEVWAGAFVRIDLSEVGSADYLSDHANDIDTWLREQYHDARLDNPSADDIDWSDLSVKASVDADDSDDVSFPGTIDGVLALVKSSTSLSDVAYHAVGPNREASGGFISGLRDHLASLDPS
jgi:hypothetical protein